MSYCRMASDDGKSDVYCYGTNNGVTDTIQYNTHVAVNYPSALLKGASFQDYSLRAFEERLLALRIYGLHIPQSALDRITEEIDAETRKNSEEWVNRDSDDWRI